MFRNSEENPDLIPVSNPFIWGDEFTYIKKAIDEGWISSRGKYVRDFEEAIARVIGVKYAVAASNGTNALHLALTALGIGSDDEVIVPDFSMISPILAVLYCGATPVPVDADSTWNIDPSLVEEKISEKTRAIIVVHTYGHPAMMPKLMEIARKHSLFVIEDVAEAFGAEIVGKPAGSFGDVSCFSFYANKIITTGEGGMLTMNNKSLYDSACWKRDLCFGSDSETRFIHREIGYNYRLTSLQAAFGLAQMKHFRESVETKISIAAEYNKLLEGIEGLTLPPCEIGVKNVYWVYGVVVGEKFGVSRAELQRLLLEAGVETRRFFYPVHRQPIIKRKCPGPFNVSLDLSENGLYLPSFIGMSSESIRKVAETIKSIHLSAGNKHFA